MPKRRYLLASDMAQFKLNEQYEIYLYCLICRKEIPGKITQLCDAERIWQQHHESIPLVT
jgi:hypothetical protein